MNTAILEQEVQEYIQQHLNADLNSLVFKKSPFPEASMSELIVQIKGKLTAQKKLPLWFETPGIYYPEKVPLEQTSSEITARYKASLVEGKNLADLTGGFGIDSFYFSQKVQQVLYIEQNTQLSQIAQWNFKQLESNHIKVENANALSYLKTSSKKFDWIYADPARRDDQKRKVFLLEDCSPNIPENLNLIWEHTDKLLLKSAPLLDLEMGISALKNVKEIHIVALKNEVKELNWILHKDYQGPVLIQCAELSQTKPASFSFYHYEEKESKPDFSIPLTYLYEPNAAVLKAGAFKTIATKYGLYKLAVNSHLYTSEKRISFPGRSFIVIEVLPFHKKSLRKRFAKTNANITTRNFPWNVAKIRKELQISEGGKQFFFFTTDLNNNHLVIICKKI